MLAPDEREQASRFVSASLRQRFTRKRIALRQILSTYARTRAADLSFRKGAHGKPYLLDRGDTASPLEYLSDAGEYVLFAIAMQRAIGVDIEAIRPIKDADDIIEQHFLAIERAAYRRLGTEQRPVAFFSAWTRKEAYIKAIGLGLHLPLDSFSVNIDPTAPAHLIEIDGDPKASQ